VALTTFGGLFMLLGVMLFFDGALLALGNVGVVLFFLSSASFLRIISFPVPFSIREPHTYTYSTHSDVSFSSYPSFALSLSPQSLSLSLSLSKKKKHKKKQSKIN